MNSAARADAPIIRLTFETRTADRALIGALGQQNDLHGVMANEERRMCRRLPESCLGQLAP